MGRAVTARPPCRAVCKTETMVHAAPHAGMREISRLPRGTATGDARGTSTRSSLFRLRFIASSQKKYRSSFFETTRGCQRLWREKKAGDATYRGARVKD